MTADVTVLQEALSAEHAAIFGYGVAGARLSGAARRDALSAYDAHRARRDRWRELLVAAGEPPGGAAPAYALPFPVRSAREASRLAAHLETQAATVYARLVGASTGADRELAARALQDAAVRAARWSGSGAAFPGLPDRR